MNKAILHLSLLMSLIFILMLSCKSKKSEPIYDGPQIELDSGPTIVAEPLSNSTLNNNIITVRAQYSTVGPLLPNPIHITQEITYQDGQVIRDKSITKTSGLKMIVTQEYDEKNQLKSLKTEQNGEQSVYQINKYTDDDLLLSEFRLEKNTTGYDTILYEYHYPKDRPNPMNYYRTNNGKKVTEMTLTTKGNKEILDERAFSTNGYVGISITTRTKNKKGKVVKEQKTSISSDWQDKTKIDTTVYEPSYYEFDEKGRLVRQESHGVLSVNGVVQSFYSEDGIIQKKIIEKFGKPKQTIIFKRV